MRAGDGPAGNTNGRTHADAMKPISEAPAGTCRSEALWSIRGGYAACTGELGAMDAGRTSRAAKLPHRRAGGSAGLLANTAPLDADVPRDLSAFTSWTRSYRASLSGFIHRTTKAEQYDRF
jgi:hypothetical protein